jgi:hypothetical protein
VERRFDPRFWFGTALKVDANDKPQQPQQQFRVQRGGAKKIYKKMQQVS